jgi:hypothetical protein
MVRSRLDSLVAIQSKAKMIKTVAANKPNGIKGSDWKTRWLRRPSVSRDAAVRNPCEEHTAVNLLRERPGSSSNQLCCFSIHSTYLHPTPSVHSWAGQRIQPRAHHQVEPTTRPVDNSAAHIPQGGAARAGGHCSKASTPSVAVRGRRWAERSWLIFSCQHRGQFHLPSTAFLHAWKAGENGEHLLAGRCVLTWMP